jgi:Spy/CpxP family protein refolding chaperone
MNTIYRMATGGVLVLFLAAVILSCKPGRNDPEAFYGQGFGMGYASGCFDTSGFMKRDLNLTNQQVKEIERIDSKFRKEYYEDRADYDRVNMLRKEHHAAIDAVLNPDQKKKFEGIYRDRWAGWGPKRMYRHMGGYYGAGYGMGYASGCFMSNEAMKDELNLTGKQVKKIDEIDREYRDKYYENRNDYDAVDRLRREQKEAIERVLLPDQKKNYEAIYNDRWRGRGMHRGMGGHMMRHMGGHMMGY